MLGLAGSPPTRVPTAWWLTVSQAVTQALTCSELHKKLSQELQVPKNPGPGP